MSAVRVAVIGHVEWVQHARLHEPLERGAIVQLHDTFEEPGGRRRRRGARAAVARRRDALLSRRSATTPPADESERVLQRGRLRPARRAPREARRPRHDARRARRRAHDPAARRQRPSGDRRSAGLGRAGGVRRRLLHGRRSRARWSPRRRARVARGHGAAARERGREPRAGRRAGGLGARPRRALRPGRSAGAAAPVRLDRGRRRRPLPGRGRQRGPLGGRAARRARSSTPTARATCSWRRSRSSWRAGAGATRRSRWPRAPRAAQLTRRGGGPTLIRHLYVHVPFCAHRCGYCDFVTVTGHADLRERYVDAVLAELEQERERLAPALETVFLGGGTPTLLGPALLDRLLAGLPAAPELTVEANPETVDDELAAMLAGRGVRVSLGAQSFGARAARRAGAPRHARSGARRRGAPARRRASPTSRSTCSSACPGWAAASSIATSTRRSRWSPSTSPATSSRPSPARASRTATAPSSRARPSCWRITTST